MKTWNKYTKKELLALPRRKWCAIDCSMHGVFRIHGGNKIIVGTNTSTTYFNFEGGK